jgi:hypothetical protein
MRSFSQQAVWVGFMTIRRLFCGAVISRIKVSMAHSKIAVGLAITCTLGLVTGAALNARDRQIRQVADEPLRAAAQAAGISPAHEPPSQSSTATPNASSENSELGADDRALIARYCATCHGGQRPAGALDLRTIGSVESDSHRWEKVRRKLLAGEMPPPSAPQPPPMEIAGTLSRLEKALDAAWLKAPNPGRVVVHRLNRVEYTNSIRDLLALDIDGKSLLPADDAGYGFDNVADVLSMTPGLLDRYVLAANKISRLALGDPTLKPSLATYRLPYLTLLQSDRVSEDLPFGSRGGIAIRHNFPLDGEYVIRIKLQRNQLNIGNEIRGLDVPNEIDLRIDGKRVALLKPEIRDYRSGIYTASEDKADDALQVRVAVTGGNHLVGVAFNRSMWYVEGLGMSRLPASSDGFASGRYTEQNYGRIDAGLDALEIQGPFNGVAPKTSASRQRIFSCYPTTQAAESKCAEEIASTLARRAFRRSISAEDVKPLLSFFAQARGEGGFEDGVEALLVRVLSDPEFLFRIERDPVGAKPGTVHPISDFELASRLSFFAWSSIPDDELLDVARRRALRAPGAVERQLARMMADSRADAFRKNFFGQWLYLRNVDSQQPDAKAFPEWDENLRRAFATETDLFLQDQISADRSALELLTASYTFVNERLAKHYGITGVSGSHFRKVPLPDATRGGILGQGSVLMVTSYANRTSPVIRGKWILENLFGTPPPPPPENVPPLAEPSAAQPKTMRERVEQHRSNPVCSSCHSRMDPLGFALENFDGIGKWRTHDGASLIDPSGRMPGGQTFNTPSEFRALLQLRERLFLETLVSKLLTYATGRGIEEIDGPAVRQIVAASAKDQYRWSALIREVVKSAPFQMRKVG